MKRWIPFILAISLCMTFLACSNQPAAQPNSADSDSDSGATPVVTSGAEEINEGDDSTPVSTEDVPAGSSSPETESSETAIQPTEKEETSDNPSEPEHASAPPRETEPSTPSQPTEPAKQSEEPKQTETPENSEQPTTSEQSTEIEDSMPVEPPVTEKDEPSKPPTQPAEKPTGVYTQEDYNRIISEVIAYAESYKSKGFTFEWKEDMEFGWEIGYFGTPRIKHEGLEVTIELLMLHVDKIYKTGTDLAYGLNSDSVTYKVVQITIDGDIAFAVIYGG